MNKNTILPDLVTFIEKSLDSITIETENTVKFSVHIDIATGDGSVFITGKIDNSSEIFFLSYKFINDSINFSSSIDDNSSIVYNINDFKRVFIDFINSQVFKKYVEIMWGWFSDPTKGLPF